MIRPRATQLRAAPQEKRRCDLQRLFGRLAKRVPVRDDEHFVFTAASFPPVPARLQTDRLLIAKSFHDYNTHFRMDALWFQADKEMYRQLALLALAVVLRPMTRVRLRLLHPKSDIKNLILLSEWKSYRELSPSYQAKPMRFSYWPKEARKHPWPDLSHSPRELPHFELSNTAQCVAVEGDRAKRDTVYGLGRDEAAVLFAELLLNLSRPMSKLGEFELESEVGFRGVAPASAEVRLALPGSISFLNEWWGRSRKTPRAHCLAVISPKSI